MDSPADRMPEPRLPGYVTGRRLGRGSAGQVWEAVRGEDGRRVAVKVVDPVHGPQAGLREAAVLERVVHEHVVRLLEVAQLADGRLALVTELADGGTLASVVAGRGHLTPGEVVTVLSPLARTLGDLHDRGVVHGDVSPGNILFHADGKPLLGDLGVSRIAGEVRPEVWGSGGYVAPEVLDGMAPQPAADVYGAGAVAWLCLTGAPPEPTPLRRPLDELVPGLPARMVAVVSACLSGRPEQRPSAGEVARELFESAAPEPVALAVGGDPAAGLTHRIRQQAAVERRRSPSHARPRWSHHRAGLVAAVFVAVAVLFAGLGAGARVAYEHVGRQPAPVHAARAQSGEAPAPTPPASPSASPRRTQAPAPGPRSRPALRTSPARVLQQLVGARALAWRRGSVPLLRRALAARSVAFARDRGDLRRAARLGVRYDGLRFTVRSARVLGGDRGEDVRVRARVERSAYRLVGASGTGRASARASEAVEFRLRWLGPRHGWRLVDWRPAA